MGRTLRHRHRDSLSDHWRRIETGTDKRSRLQQQRLARDMRKAETVLAMASIPLPSPPVRPQAGRR
jgi:hypothetical protein